MAIRCSAKVRFHGEEHISVYDSSEWAERGFCKKCGSHLFYKLKDLNEYQMPVGLFDSQEDLHLNLQVFIDKKPSFYSFANQTKEMTEAEVLEKYAPKKNT